MPFYERYEEDYLLKEAVFSCLYDLLSKDDSRLPQQLQPSLKTVWHCLCDVYINISIFNAGSQWLLRGDYCNVFIMCFYSI